jgi:hypothetical protein
VEAVVFHNEEKPEVREKLKGFVVVQLHCDHKDKALRASAVELQGRLAGAVILPQYVVYDPRSKRVLGKWAYGGPEEGLSHALWLKRLDDALAAYRTAKT